MASVFIRERRGQFKHRDMETHREVGQRRVGQRLEGLEGGGGKPGSGSHERLRAGEKIPPPSPRVFPDSLDLLIVEWQTPSSRTIRERSVSCFATSFMVTCYANPRKFI